MIRLALWLGLMLLPLAVCAEERLTDATLSAARDSLSIDLTLSGGVAWRLALRDPPARVELDFVGLALAPMVLDKLRQAEVFADVRGGALAPNETRLELHLTAPMTVGAAGMSVDGDGVAHLRLDLRPATPHAFAARLSRPDPAPRAAPAVRDPAPVRRIVIDPGHGGRDPGAQVAGMDEADIVLDVALTLARLLAETTDFEVVLTRDADTTLRLGDRLEAAQAARGDVFVSLHADTLPQGYAEGAAVYTLTPEAGAAADAWLRDRQAPDSLIGGLDMAGQGADVSAALLDLVRRDTVPRSAALARRLIDAIGDNGLPLYKAPDKHGNFVVLRGADMPAVLVELGFMSSGGDRARLADPDWRAFMARALRDGLVSWAAADARSRAALRQ